MKRTEEVTHEDGSVPRQALYYMENKGYISPHRKRVGRRVLREYTEADVELAKLIWEYHNNDGLMWDAAYERASKKLNRPLDY
jgi:DNA-binding transcriptional MerR regulator